jgi:phosphoribosylglycinamide formyltransferase 2
MNFVGPFRSSSNRLMLLGGGELGKEVVIEAQRLGCFTIVVDKYSNAPAMHVSHERYVIDMNNYEELKKMIELEKPTHIIPEIEAINIDCLLQLEKEGFNVVPSANAVYIAMHRQRLRDLANSLGIKTTKYKFAEDYEEYINAVEEIGLPCVVKPSMSSSGKGQSILREECDIKVALDYAHKNLRGNCSSVIIEEFLTFDYEITLLTVNCKGGIRFCNPIMHKQENGDFVFSKQPYNMSDDLLNKCKSIATEMVNGMGGFGIFGMEFFISGNEVYFNECSPRPHDTGYLTLKTQNMSEFELHVRALLGLRIPEIVQYIPGVSKAINYFNDKNYLIENPKTIIELPDEGDFSIYYFGKPNVKGNSKRRVGLIISVDDDINRAEKIIDNVFII